MNTGITATSGYASLCQACGALRVACGCMKISGVTPTAGMLIFYTPCIECRLTCCQGHVVQAQPHMVVHGR